MCVETPQVLPTSPSPPEKPLFFLRYFTRTHTTQNTNTPSNPHPHPHTATAPAIATSAHQSPAIWTPAVPPSHQPSPDKPPSLHAHTQLHTHEQSTAGGVVTGSRGQAGVGVGVGGGSEGMGLCAENIVKVFPGPGGSQVCVYVCVWHCRHACTSCIPFSARSAWHTHVYFAACRKPQTCRTRVTQAHNKSDIRVSLTV